MILPPEKLCGLVRLARSWSKAEGVENDICIIGSWARGDANALSDFDLVMFCNGEPNGGAELAYLDCVPVSLFKVNALRLLRSESVDFYSVNNVFEGQLIFGRGRILDRLRQGLRGTPIDYESTRVFLCCAFSNRLRDALLELPLSCALGMRDLKTALAKLNLYRLLFAEKADPWKLIPYRNRPSSPLELIIIGLCCASDVERSLEELDIDWALRGTFKEVEEVDRIVEAVKEAEGYAGKYVENYFRLYMLVEELVRRTAFPALPTRLEIDGYYPNVDHAATVISFENGNPCWLVSYRGDDGRVQLEQVPKDL